MGTHTRRRSPRPTKQIVARALACAAAGGVVLGTLTAFLIGPDPVSHDVPLVEESRHHTPAVGAPIVPPSELVSGAVPVPPAGPVPGAPVGAVPPVGVPAYPVAPVQPPAFNSGLPDAPSVVTVTVPADPTTTTASTTPPPPPTTQAESVPCASDVTADYCLDPRGNLVRNPLGPGAP